MNSNVCLGCRFGSVKIEISVAQKCKLEDFSEQTREFGAEIIRVTGTCIQVQYINDLY